MMQDIPSSGFVLAEIFRQYYVYFSFKLYTLRCHVHATVTSKKIIFLMVLFLRFSWKHVIKRCSCLCRKVDASAKKLVYAIYTL